MSGYTELAKAIIKQMETIVGPVAKTQANKVEGMKVNHDITIKGNPQKAIKGLLDKYRSLMGPVAITIARKAVENARSKDQGRGLPEISAISRILEGR
jgi:hypothetical protein